jgi:mono/diheme cytochrome c family protein
VRAPEQRLRVLNPPLSELLTMHFTQTQENSMNVFNMRVLLASAVLTLSAGAFAQSSPVDLGKAEYESSCASCHGVAGKGDGRMRAFLVKAPSDLTTLAKRNGGAFPTQLVWEMIDGRTSDEIGPHGSREMPVWGTQYRQRALQSPATSSAPEWYVRGQIVALLDYLSRLQAK